jgi:hypothetical protein
MIEFPGFVYHCHILPHEDNEMMRPIMLTPSDKYMNHPSNSIAAPINTLPLQQYKNLNINSIFLSPLITTTSNKNESVWYQKAKQINYFLNCPS